MPSCYFAIHVNSVVSVGIDMKLSDLDPLWAICQIRKIMGFACAGMPGTLSPPLGVTHPSLRRSACVTAIWQEAMGFLSDSGHACAVMKPGSGGGGGGGGRTFPHSRRMPNPQFYASGEGPNEGTGALDYFQKIVRERVTGVICLIRCYVRIFTKL